MTYSQYQQLKPSDLRRLCGVHHQTFIRMVAVLEEQVEQKKLKPGKQAQVECRFAGVNELGVLERVPHLLPCFQGATRFCGVRQLGERSR